MRPWTIGAFEEPNYERGLKGTWNNRNELKRNSPGAYEVISLFRPQVETLESVVYFLKDELKEKSTLFK